MIVDIYIAILIIAVALFVIAIKEQKIVMTGVSLLFWIFLYAQSLYIVVPYHAYADMGSGVVNITTGSHEYFEFGLSALSLGMVFLNLIMLIINIWQYRQEMKMP